LSTKLDKIDKILSTTLFYPICPKNSRRKSKINEKFYQRGYNSHPRQISHQFTTIWCELQHLMHTKCQKQAFWRWLRHHAASAWCWCEK